MCALDVRAHPHSSVQRGQTGETKKTRQHIDGIPAKCEPGLLAYVAAYLGIVEPQMRLTQHLHMLMQIFGSTYPRQLFASGQFKDTIRRVWS